MRVANRSSATALLMPAAMVLLLVAALAQAQPYPSKPVRVAVGFPAARPPELIQRMNKLWVASLRTQETRDLLYGSAGNGSVAHVGMEMFKSLLGVSIAHIPYKGTGQIVGDLLGGSVVVERDHGRQSLRNRVLPAGQALAWLGQSLERGAALAGVSLPKPELELHERNWLIGVQQRMELAIDLRAVEALPGLDLSFRFAPLEARAVERATPKPVQLGPGAKELHWPLELGALNRLTWRTWRWSRLGLGAVAVALVLGLALLLQRLRLRAGFGFPQLPR